MNRNLLAKRARFFYNTAIQVITGRWLKFQLCLAGYKILQKFNVFLRQIINIDVYLRRKTFKNGTGKKRIVRSKGAALLGSF